jgi:hypothetical protein
MDFRYTPIKDIPKNRLYDYYTTLKIALQGAPDLRVSFSYYACITDNVNFNDIKPGFQGPLKVIGQFQPSANSAYFIERNIFVDLELPLNFIDDAIQAGFGDCYLQWRLQTFVGTAGGANSTPTASDPDWSDVANANGSFPTSLLIAVTAEQLAAMPTSLGAKPEDITYTSWDAPNMIRSIDNDTSFFDLMGQILYSTGEDTNFTVYEIFLRRLGEGGISINSAMRLLAEVGSSLDVNVLDKYRPLLGDNADRITDSQSWLLTRGPFFDADAKKPYSRDVVLTCLQYLWSDLLTLEYFAGETSFAADATLKTRGDLTG